MSDYLFDKAGAPDPEIERLEGLLAPLAYRGAAPALPRRRRPRALVVAAVATAAAAAIVGLLLAHPWRPAPPPIGAWIDTGDAGARLASEIGVVELGPHTRARVVKSGDQRREMELARGTLVATIHAPPRRFVVTTPHAVVTDLGCAFEITVDEAGRGRVVVREGRVGVAGADGRELVVAAGGRVDLSERGPAPPQPPHTAAPAPTPAPVPPPIPAPATPPPSAPPAPSPSPRHHATQKPPAAHAIKKIAPPPPARSQPAHAPPKSEPTRIQHDALKDLQHDVE